MAELAIKQIYPILSLLKAGRNRANPINKPELAANINPLTFLFLHLFLVL